MLPFDRKPWAATLAKLVILLTITGVVLYVLWIRQTRPLDWGERWILGLLLIAVIPPNLAIIRRKPGLATTSAFASSPNPLAR